MEFDLSKINFSKYDEKRGLTLPKEYSKDLAEFWGIMAGDGYMNKYGQYFSLAEIAGDSRLDREYLLLYVNHLIKRLFNINPSLCFKKNENTMYLRIMSKGFLEYLDFGQERNKRLPWLSGLLRPTFPK